MHTLGYADDAALIDKTTAVATKRITAIAKGSRRDADMEISITKTEVMHVREQGRVTRATSQEAKAVCTVVCPNIGCNKVFFNAHGAKCHAGRCKWRNTYNIDRILAVSGATGSPHRRFKIRWAGYGPEHDTWQKREDIHPEAITSFLKANNLYDYEWQGDRCPHCDKPCASTHGVKIHLRHCRFAPEKSQRFVGTKAEQKVLENKLEAQQKERAWVRCL